MLDAEVDVACNCVYSKFCNVKTIGCVRVTLKDMHHLKFETLWMMLDWLNQDKLQLLAVSV